MKVFDCTNKIKYVNLFSLGTPTRLVSLKIKSVDSLNLIGQTRTVGPKSGV